MAQCNIVFRALRVACVPAAALLSVGCGSLQYDGDRRLAVAVTPSASDRYVVNLGQVDFSRLGQSVHELSNLPEAELRVVFEIVSFEDGRAPLADTRPITATVELELTNERGETVVSTKAPLSSWSWVGLWGEDRTAFVYRSGRVREISREANITRYEAAKGVDGGWGTYFTPRRNGRYTLRVVTLDPDPSSSRFLITLQVAGGGWK